MIVSVIIPVYRDDQRVNKCLEALNLQTYPKEKFEVILVNNDPDGQINIYTDHSLNLIVVSENKVGSYAARNKGIITAKGEITAFTDSDAIPEISWIEKGVSSMRLEKGKRTILAGKVQLTYKDPGKLTLAECYEKYFGFPHQRNASLNLSVMVAGNVFIFSDSFTRIGLFNSNLTSGGDTEFSNRATSNGYTIKYNPHCIVFHPAKAHLNDLLQKRRRIFGGKVFRSIKVDNRRKLPAVILVLYKQSKRYLSELFYVCSRIRVDNRSDRIRLTFAITLIFFSLYYEALVILMAGKMRRR
jgi:GT2 family glycosyltransferase